MILSPTTVDRKKKRISIIQSEHIHTDYALTRHIDVMIY